MTMLRIAFWFPSVVLNTLTFILHVVCLHCPAILIMYTTLQSLEVTGLLEATYICLYVISSVGFLTLFSRNSSCIYHIFLYMHLYTYVYV